MYFALFSSNLYIYLDTDLNILLDILLEISES
jgi:hypothetical protein